MKRTSVTQLVLLLCFAIAAPAQAAYDYFLRLDGIDGESTTRNYEKWIEIQSYAFGASNATSGTGSGAGTGKAQFDDFAFTKLLDTASPGILEHLLLGKHLASAELDIVLAGGNPAKLFAYTFTDVLFADVAHSGAIPDRPLESVTFAFGKLKVESWVLDPKGGTRPGPGFEFDVANQAPVPEPATGATMILGLMLLAGASRLAKARNRFDRRCA
jgi:type VI secretion system secreted protein Hcp